MTARPPVNLVMPMAGRGSRFGRAGFGLPKPLLTLDGQPFFWWATESVRRSFDVRRLVFVVLQEHIAEHAIDRVILDRFPEAELVALPDVTSGALATAMAGCGGLDDGFLLVNDCDQAFRADALAAALPGMADASGVLCHFRARDPRYSFARYDDAGHLVETAEKRAISDMAIAGLYGFRHAATFLRHAEEYARTCPYDEWFISGVYNTMVAAGETVRGVMLDAHLSFGTPEEFAAAEGHTGTLWTP